MSIHEALAELPRAPPDANHFALIRALLIVNPSSRTFLITPREKNFRM